MVKEQLEAIKILGKYSLGQKVDLFHPSLKGDIYLVKFSYVIQDKYENQVELTLEDKEYIDIDEIEREMKENERNQKQ